MPLYAALEAERDANIEIETAMKKLSLFLADAEEKGVEPEKHCCDILKIGSYEQATAAVEEARKHYHSARKKIKLALLAILGE